MENCELLAPGIAVCTDPHHRVSADGLLLARFATLRPGMQVVDLCAGNGLVGAALFSRPCAPDALVAVDIAPEACALARQTAQSPGIEGRMRVIEADVLALGELMPPGWADLVVVNPPYFAMGGGKVPPNPRRRLARTDDGCPLPELCLAASRLLRPGGRLALCHRPERLLPLTDAMHQAGITPKRAALVAHTPRHKPFLLLIEGTKGGRPGLMWEAGQFILQTGNKPASAYKRSHYARKTLHCGYPHRQFGGYVSPGGGHAADGGLYRRRGHPGYPKAAESL